ncbi:TonB-dependent receptor [Luteitalea sp. TBR-22]|uniref:TonB-dependent receptor n=1 Tax=Luteitalea sp. TBR-22 TaxID=2802971 RepID=UPI001AF721D4|nr:carboxypeptidase regulatory-like domain-containing protein [Luteitalea sp. TBR-22]
MTRFLRSLVHAAALLCVLAPAARAQFDSATVLGFISDQSGAAIPGVTVTLTNPATGISTTAVTDERGQYQLLNVRPGTYTVKAELQGFTTAIAENVVVTVNARQRVDLGLSVGGIGETVQVTGAARLLESESSDRGTVIGREQIVNLPLNGRAYADLALLSPGVRRSSISNSRDASFNVNGLRSALNNFILDGVDNNSYGTSNQGFSNQVVQVSPDAVEEFKVQTNNFSAEFGRAGGAVINASFRSGTNQFRGAAWEYNRNTKLNATGFFKPSSGVKPEMNRNQFGGVLGGPIVRDRAFFFFNYEGFREVSRQLTFASIPTMAQRQGNLGVPIRNPITGEVYADGVVPQSAITSFAKQVLAGLPEPTRPGLSNNFDSMPRREDFNDKFDIKFDQKLDAKTTMFFRYSHRDVTNFEPGPIPGDIGSPANNFVDVLNKQYAGGLTRTLTGNSLLELRVGVSQTDAGKSALGTGTPNMLEAYGITGLPTDTYFSGGLTQQSVGGWTAWGRQSSNPQFQNPTVINLRANYSWIKGAHTLKTGYEYQSINTEVDDVNPKYGADSYSGQFSRPTGAAANAPIFNLADFMFGARNSYDLVNPYVFNLRQRMHFGYLQDDWKAAPNLTVNLGVRYEFGTPQWEEDNYLTNFDPATNTLIQARDGSIYDRALVNPDRNNWAPRVGAAWSLTPKTVLRSAYGLSYIHFNRLGGENLLSFNGPHVVPVSITQQPSQGLCTATQAPTTCFRTTQQGYPEGLNVPANFNPLNGRVNYIPKDLQSGYVQSWHVTLQRELFSNVMVDIAYIGNKSDHLMILGDLNQARPNAPGENTLLQARRPIQGYQFIQSAFDGGRAEYRALQVKVERRWSDGLYLLNSFTWSRAKDNASGHLETANGDNSRVNMANLEGEYGLSGYNQPLNNTTSVVWELPFGRDRRFGNDWNAILDGIAGGWRLTAINAITSGLPVNLTYNPSAQFSVSGAPTYRPNISGEIYAAEGSQTIDNWFNRDAVTVPTDPSQPFGNAPRNVAAGPAIWTLDLGLHKGFGLGVGQARLEVRIEAFNVLNRTNFGAPNGNRSSTDFGTIRSLATTPRQIQLGARISF